MLREQLYFLDKISQRLLALPVARVFYHSKPPSYSNSNTAAVVHTVDGSEVCCRYAYMHVCMHSCVLMYTGMLHICVHACMYMDRCTCTSFTATTTQIKIECPSRCINVTYVLLHTYYMHTWMLILVTCVHSCTYMDECTCTAVTTQI